MVDEYSELFPVPIIPEFRANCLGYRIIQYPDGRKWKEYVFECISCKEQYTREMYSRRTTPYCASCGRKITALKARISSQEKNTKMQEEILRNFSAFLTKKFFFKSSFGGPDAVIINEPMDDLIKEFMKTT